MLWLDGEHDDENVAWPACLPCFSLPRAQPAAAGLAARHAACWSVLLLLCVTACCHLHMCKSDTWPACLPACPASLCHTHKQPAAPGSAASPAPPARQALTPVEGLQMM